MPRRELRKKTGENIRVPVADLDVVLAPDSAAHKSGAEIAERLWRQCQPPVDPDQTAGAPPVLGLEHQTGQDAAADRRLCNAGSVEPMP